MKFLPFPEIQTDRLYLRRILESDVDVILFLRSDKTVNKYIQRPESERTKNKADALRFITMIDGGIEKTEFITWGITLKESTKIAGSICLWNFSENKKEAEVGYGLIPSSQGKGIMSEALKSVIAFGFDELKLNKIEAFTHKENESSKLLLVRNGFLFMKERKDEGNPKNMIYVIDNPAGSARQGEAAADR